MKQSNVIRVAVNPSNLIQPVKINDRVFSKNLISQQNYQSNDIFDQINLEKTEINSFVKTQAKPTQEVYQDRSFIKSLIPKTRVYSFSSCKY